MKQTNVFSKDADNQSTAVFTADDAAGQALVKSRKRVSALFSSFSSVMREAGIDEACRQLNRLEAERARVLVKADVNYKPLKFDPNEARRYYMTIMEVAQASEYKAEVQGLAYSKERSFKAPAFALELAYRREEMPVELRPKLRDLPPDLASKKRKLIGAYGRNWQRRSRKIHFIQSYLHLGFVKKDDESTNQNDSRIYFDRITDLLTLTASAAGDRGEPFKRFIAAAEGVLEEFRKDKAHIYAPEWTPKDWLEDAGVKAKAATDKAEKSDKTETKSPGPKAWKAGIKALEFNAQELACLAVEHNLPWDVARQEAYDAVTAAFAVEPEPPERGSSDDGVSPVIPNNDTASHAAAQSASFSPSASASSSDLLNKSENVLEFAPTQMSYQNLSPEDAARSMIEACESVGATMFKTAFTAIYPLVGMAAELPFDERSEPRKKGVNMGGAELKARIPDYIRRNLEKQHNIAVRVWGPIIQTDDCSVEFYERIKHLCFAAIRTSPKSYQVWLALSSDYVGADGKRTEALTVVRKLFFEKCKELKESANGGAYNSIRMPGTLNVKEKYAPDFPRIELVYVSVGRITGPEELDAAGLLAPAPRPELRLVNPTPRAPNVLAPRYDHQYFVNKAPLKEDGLPNLNSADISFSLHRLSVGDSRAEVEAMLRGVRDKAARRPDYVKRTLDAAEDWRATHPAPGRRRASL